MIKNIINNKCTIYVTNYKGHADSRCEGRRYRGQGKMNKDDSLATLVLTQSYKRFDMLFSFLKRCRPRFVSCEDVTNKKLLQWLN